MAGQETLIYIDENDQVDAGVSANKYTKEDVRNRAYYNTLGARLVKKFLANENVDVTNIYNIHNIQKVLEELDVSDIMLNNIHIDVRVVFNENYIFIPKSHFEYDILPDIYVVLLMSNDKKYMKFLGFFEPKLINKNNQNEEYYFIEKEKLSTPENLKTFVENFKGNTAQKLSESETDTSDMLILSLIDHDISEKDKKQLLKNLVKSADLRDRFIEFENFEMLSYRAEHSPEIVKPANSIETAEIENKADTIEISLDKAAEATAAALQEFTSAKIPEESPKEEAIMNGFNNLERNLPDFTPENADKTLDEYENEFMMNANLEDLTLEVNDLPEINSEEQLSSADSSPVMETVDVIQENIETAPTEGSEIPVDLDSLAEISEDKKELNSSNLTENQAEELTVNFDELPALDISKENTTGDIQEEIVNLDEIAEVSSDKKESNEILQETINLEELTPVSQEIGTKEEIQQETMNFDDIESVDDSALSENSIEEPALELENFENLTLDHNENKNENILSEDTEPEILNTENIEDLSKEPELMIDMDMPSEISFDENVTIDEHINRSNEKSQTVENNINENIPSNEELASFEDITNSDSNINSVENLILEDEKLQSSEITEEDKELDQMLALENLTENSISDESSNDIPPAQNNSFESDAEDPDDINIDDLKDLGLNVEGLESNETDNEDINTGNLISEIDDLLASEEKETTPQNAASPESADSTDNKLEMLFNSGESADEDNSGDFEEDDHYIDQQKVSAPEKGKKAMIIAAALVAVIAAAAGTGLFLKNKNNSSDMLSQNPIGNDNRPTNNPIEQPTPDNTDLMTNTPDSNPTAAQNPADTIVPPPPPAETKPQQPAAAKPQPKDTQKNKPADAKNAATKEQVSATPPKGTPTPYVSIKSLTWEVPDYLSYSDNIKQYLQTAGKSIRLTLSSDLLLANEYAYSNQVRVELKLKNNGTVEDAKITKSSGSDQINNIVLRTVNDTLNVVKPAPGEIPTDNFKLGLIINF